MTGNIEAFLNALKNLEALPASSKSSEMVTHILKWSQLVAGFRKIQPTLPKEDIITVSMRLSSVLSVMITDLGMCDDYVPLPELVSVVRTGKKFNALEADSETALVYFMHKAIECLGVAAVKISAKTAANSSVKKEKI